MHLDLSTAERDDFTAWYATEHPRIHRALRITGLDEHDARDLTDEAFTRALERWPRVQAMEHRSAWVRTVAVNLARRRWRQRGRERRAYERMGPSDGATVDSYLAELLEVMSVLSPRERTAIALRYVLGFTESEIADAMRVRPGTVATTLHRARAKLQQTLTDPQAHLEESRP